MGWLVGCITGHGRGRIVQCHISLARLADRQHPPQQQRGGAERGREDRGGGGVIEWVRDVLGVY